MTKLPFQTLRKILSHRHLQPENLLSKRFLKNRPWTTCCCESQYYTEDTQNEDAEAMDCLSWGLASSQQWRWVWQGRIRLWPMTTPWKISGWFTWKSAVWKGKSSSKLHDIGYHVNFQGCIMRSIQKKEGKPSKTHFSNLGPSLAVNRNCNS